MAFAVTATSSVDHTSPVVSPIPIGQILPWATFGTLLSLLMVYFVGSEQGAFSMMSGSMVHEFVHDARHLLGFPCH